MISKLLKQGSHYASGTVLLSIASLISFPILTRYLPMSEYGILSLLTTILGLFVALNKLGLQQSVLRFHDKSNANFNFSLFILLVFSLIVVALLLSVINYFYSYPLISDYFYILCLSASLQAYKSVILNCYAAEQKSIKVNLFNVLYKYLGLFMMMICLLYIGYDALSVFYSIVFTDILFSLLISFLWIKRVKWGSIDFSLVRNLTFYGFPLMVVEFMQVSHAFVDRFIIEYYLNAKSVAEYSAPYSIADIISSVIFGAIATALVPIYIGLWNDGKKKETELFLTQVSNYFLLLLPIIITGTYVVSKPLMSVLASDTYAESAFILPVALAGIAIFSSTFIYSAGLKLKTSQIKVVVYVFESLVLNIILNISFVNEYGILASALSTIVSYFWMSFRYFLASQKIITIKFNYVYFLKGVLVSFFMYLTLINIGTVGSDIFKLLYYSIVGLVSGCAFLCVVDRNLRALVIKYFPFSLSR